MNEDLFQALNAMHEAHRAYMMAPDRSRAEREARAEYDLRCAEVVIAFETAYGMTLEAQ